MRTSIRCGPVDFRSSDSVHSVSVLISQRNYLLALSIRHQPSHCSLSCVGSYIENMECSDEPRDCQISLWAPDATCDQLLTKLVNIQMQHPRHS